MNRKTTNLLKKADKEDGKRLIIVYGMKCVGKTYTVLDYVKSEYEEYLYIDAANDNNFQEYIQANAGCGIIELLSGFFKIEEEYLVNIPIILDEPDADLINVKTFEDYEGRLKIFLVFSDSSKLELIDKNSNTINNSLLVNIDSQYDFVAQIHMFPMNFGDFLVALGKEWYDEVITGHLMSRRKLPEMLHEELLDLYDLYLQIGGMPEILEEYVRLGSIENIRERQKLLKNALWMHMYTTSVDSEAKTKGVLDAVEKILEKDNHKFMYSAIRDGVTKKLYAPTVEHLKSQNAVFSISRLINQASETLCSETSDDFRLYYGDISLYDRPYGTKLTESAILQNIISSGTKAYYWESGTGAELSCVIEKEDKYIPVDIHTNGKGKGRSVSAFQKAFDGDIAIRLSEDNCKFEGNVVNIPEYAAYALKYV